MGSRKTKLILVIGILLSGASWCSRTLISGEGCGKITVIFRFDDFSGRSHTEFEKKLIAMFRDYSIPCTFGVIPFVADGGPLDPDGQGTEFFPEEKAVILKEGMAEGIIDVGLHGYSHRASLRLANVKTSEFSGLTYREQVRRCRRGKALLERATDAEVTIFIPPWNSYDANTLRCLEDLGFDCISADLRRPPSATSLDFLPCTCSLLTLRRAVASARRIRDKGPLVVALFHASDFTEMDKDRGRMTFQDLRSLLGWLKSQKDIRTLTISAAIDDEVDLGSKRLRANLLLGSVPTFFLPFADSFSPAVYRSTPSANMSMIRVWIASLSFFAGVLVFSGVFAFWLGSLVFPRLKCLASKFTYLGTALACCLCLYILRDSELYFLGALVLAVALGSCLGMWVAFLNCPKVGKETSG